MDHLEISKAVRNWFKAVTDQIDEEKLLAMLSSNGFALRFPEATLTDRDSFSRWYKGIRLAFFDQSHTIRHMEIASDGTRANLSIWVNWQARTRPEGSSQSKQCDFDAMQKWEMANEKGVWVIVSYDVVDLFDNIG
ncbi:nuclear transport factor 2 family protein [Chitinibacter sp. GC72]|uniref:nuclear transport factor 2 family protein n=1 Tax=Chitinibacter sp. GC72 TaxID=1526917 RepID=UPI0012F9B2D7|nr:nuclear transport factor 2 family protein [Chitinibacter sp. GC72]